jgi:hypothetical protein
MTGLRRGARRDSHSAGQSAALDKL